MKEDKSLLAGHPIADYMNLETWFKRWDEAMSEVILDASVLAFLLGVGWEGHASSTQKGEAMERRRLLLYLSILAGGSVMPTCHCEGNSYWTSRRIIEQAARKAVCEHVFKEVPAAIAAIRMEQEPRLIRSLTRYCLDAKWKGFLDREILGYLFEIFNPKGILFPRWKGCYKWEEETAEEGDAGMFFRWILLNIWGSKARKIKDRKLLTWARKRTYRWLVAFYPVPLKWADRHNPWVQKVMRRDFPRAHARVSMAHLKLRRMTRSRK